MLSNKAFALVAVVWFFGWAWLLLGVRGLVPFLFIAPSDDESQHVDGDPRLSGPERKQAAKE